MSALELDCDSVIVGGGLAGLVAALRLPGRVILLSGGLGATAMSTGAFTDAGEDPEAADWFLRLMEGTSCPYVRGRYATVTRVVKSGLVQQPMSYTGAPAFVSINEERPGFHNIEFMKGRSHQEIARTLETDGDAVEGLIGALSGTGNDEIFIPPVLGIGHAKNIRDRVSRALGKEVYEYAAAPSVLGLRLITALKKVAAGKAGLEKLDIVKAERIVGGRVEGVMGTKGVRSISVGANNLFIATGGPLTGLKVDGDRLFEPLTGLTVTADFEADLSPKFFSEHPLMHKGIEPKPYIHGFDNVRVIGAASCGFGLYKALVSGYRAGDGLE